MKIFHIIRNHKNISLFKDIIQECLHSGLGDVVYISSGFFQEPPKGTYSASNDVDSLGRSFCNNKIQLTLHLRGVYDYRWRTKFQTFVTNLNNSNVYKIFVNGKPFSLGQAVPIYNRNHAKVFIYEKGKTPLLEIIGSSNFTSHAYGTNNSYNTEADLVICNCEALENLIIKKIQAIDSQHGIMILNYVEDNKLKLIDEMSWIRDNLF